jgi:hypothetical protein
MGAGKTGTVEDPPTGGYQRFGAVGLLKNPEAIPQSAENRAVSAEN